jgi:hypothetical protein
VDAGPDTLWIPTEFDGDLQGLWQPVDKSEDKWTPLLIRNSID